MRLGVTRMTNVDQEISPGLLGKGLHRVAELLQTSVGKCGETADGDFSIQNPISPQELHMPR